MSKKIAVFAFEGEAMCFSHALLNSMEMYDKGYDVKLILEGTATKMPGALTKPGVPFGELFKKVLDAGLIDCACKACAAKMGVLEEVKALGIELKGELAGHPSMSRYMEEGYQILKF